MTRPGGAMDGGPVETGGPAFPWPSAEICGYNHAGGMTLRDYFAAAAIAGGLTTYAGDIARKAYAIADAMISNRYNAGEGR